MYQHVRIKNVILTYIKFLIPQIYLFFLNFDAHINEFN